MAAGVDQMAVDVLSPSALGIHFFLDVLFCECMCKRHLHVFTIFVSNPVKLSQFVWKDGSSVGVDQKMNRNVVGIVVNHKLCLDNVKNPGLNKTR